MSTTAPPTQQGPDRLRLDQPGFQPRTEADHLPRSGPEGRSVGKGLASLLGLLLVVVGIPALLVWLVGNPLPSELPNSSWLRADVTADALIDIVAVLVWLVWAHFLVCLVTEIVAARRGQLPGVVPGAGGLQVLARRLVAGVLLLAGSATMTGHAPGQAGAPAAIVSTDAGAGAAQGVSDSATALDRAGDAGLLGPAAGMAAAMSSTVDLVTGGAQAATADRAEAPVTKFYEVKPPNGRHHDTLWDIADRTLGDPFRYKELFALNKDRVQPDGRKLVDADLIQPGWQLIMPADASGPDITRVRTHAPFTTGPAEQLARAAHTSVDAAGAGQAAAAVDAAAAGQAAADGAATDSAGTVSRATAVPTAEPVLHSLVDTDDVDLGDLALGGGMVLAGLALAVSGRRGPFGDPSDEEQALRLAATPGRADLLDRSLRLLSEGRAHQRQPMPDAAAVYVNDDQVVVHLAASGEVAAPPAPWRTADEGRAWVVRAEDLAGVDPRASAPWPALVNIATTHGFDLLVDLEYAPGLVSIGGAPEIAREVALSSIVDLVTHPWSDAVDVTMVGFAGDEALADLAPGRIRHVRSIDDALTDAERSAASHEALLRTLGADGVLAGRVAGRGADLRPHVVVLSGSPTAEQTQRLSALLSRGRTGLAAVCVGQTLAARWRFTVDQGGGIDLGVLGLTGTARRLRHDDLERVVGWIRDASARAADAAAEAAVRTPQAAVAALPAAPDLVAAAGLMEEADTALARVSLLGPVDVSAPGSLSPSREPLLTELVTLVALHPGGLHDAVLRVSLWPRGVEDDVVNSTIASAVQWLGTGPDGEPLLDRDAQGRWVLSPLVHTDWPELVLVADRHQEDRHRVSRALAAGRGELFSGTPAGRYTWLAFHQAARDARAVVTALARRSAAEHAAAGDTDAARSTLRDGLTLVPRSQAVWRDYLRLVGGNDPDAAAAAVTEMHLALGGDALEPETAALVAHLSPDERHLG